MSDQEQRDGGYFVVREGMANDVTYLVEAAMHHGTIGTWAGVRWTETTPVGNRAQRRARAARKGAGTALSPNRGPTSRPVDIRMPAVARRGDEIETSTV